jgi:Fe-S cluster biogenesis protein NfuA
MDQVHRAGLVRLANLLDHHALLEQAALDPVAALLLDLYDLTPAAEAEQVERALEGIRPYIESHGGHLDVLGVVGGVVRVRLAGACVGCSGSAMTLRRGVEAALKDGFPAFVAMEVEEAAPAPARPTFIAIDDIKSVSPPLKPVFEDAAAVDQVGGMLAVEVGGKPVLLHNIDGEVYAFARGGDRRETYPVAIEAGRVKVATNVPARAPAPGAA